MMRILLYTLFVISPVFGRTMLMAKYNMGRVTGTITFTQDNIGADVNISLDLSGLPSATYTLQLHEFRVNFDRLDRCSDENIGAMIGATTITSGRGSLTASGMDLSGTKSIEGRSFAISGNGIKVCATVEADAEYITAYAHLPANIGGTIIFRQKESSPSADTFMYTDLYFVGETVVTAPLTWQINEGQVKMDIDATTSMSNRCGSTILDLYNPDASSGVGCTTENHTNCKIGDLSGKHGDITISTSSNTKLFFGDLRLPLSGDHSIIGKTIAFLTGNQYFACANIVQYPRMSAVANFSNNGVKGVIAFEQRSPLDSALVHVNLVNMNSLAGGYHVHLFPVPQKLGRTESVCDNDDVEGHFNPFNIDIDSADYPAPGNSTPDMYEVGDISGKFGTLQNLNDCNETFVDPNLQLYGKNSIIGRSMVIHRNDQSASRWICSTIWPSQDTPMYTAYAKFIYPVIGYMIMRQPKNMWYAETQVYVELNYAANGMQTATVNHTWHVHETELGNDLLRPETERCMSVGGHYNPYEVNLGGNYPTDCNPDKQFRCELGDLSGKHGKLNIRTANGKKTKYFFTDVQLPLNGPQSIMGKSIVIHDANSGAGRLGCGNLYEKIMRTAEVRAWRPAKNGGTPTGTITFTQDCVDILTCPTTVDVELTGLNNDVAGYHVHEFPLGTNTHASKVCQLSDTGGHLNPFGAPYPLPPGESLDAYEIGDLSGKFDPLTGASYSTNVLDINLPMEGPYSIVGRSIVIHKNDQNATRWACGNILETTPGSTLIQAKAVFEGEIYGSVQMSQYKYDSGDMSDTFIIVDLKYKNGTTTTGHNWHVHERRMASPGDCGSCGGHYNPYMVDLTNGYSECSMYNPLRCEMGDQSAKVGQYVIGGGKRFFTDVNLNLEATFSASKRSIVFHDVNGGAARIACADIMPDGNSIVESELSFVKTTYTSSDVENKVALSIGTSDSHVLVVHKKETLTCTTVKVYFLGDQKSDLQRLFNDVLRSSDHGQLGKYKPTAECVTGSSCMLQVSLMTVFVCLCLTKLRLLS